MCIAYISQTRAEVR